VTQKNRPESRFFCCNSPHIRCISSQILSLPKSYSPRFRSSNGTAIGKVTHFWLNNKNPKNTVTPSRLILHEQDQSTFLPVQSASKRYYTTLITVFNPNVSGFRKLSLHQRCIFFYPSFLKFGVCHVCFFDLISLIFQNVTHREFHYRGHL
jgi:hypothetical protein